MEYIEENCKIILNNNTLVFTGKIEASDYANFTQFLKEVDQAVKEDTLIYDFRALNFLNSSGIKAIAVHFLNSQKKYRIIIKTGLTWQKVGIIPLRFIRPEGCVEIDF